MRLYARTSASRATSASHRDRQRRRKAGGARVLLGGSSVEAKSKTNRVTRKMINDALRKRGRDESLRPGDGYFYFGGGEAIHWLSNSVRVKRLSDLTLERWLEEFDKLLKIDKKLRKPE